MKTNLIKKIITIAAAVTVTLAIGAGGVFAQGSVPGISDKGIIKDGNIVWLKNTVCFKNQDWYQAMSSAASLKSGSCGLTDGSTAGQWRLPSRDELLRRATNTQGIYGAENHFWSSESNGTHIAWYVKIYGGSGHEAYSYKQYGKSVWPVRSAQ